MLLRVLKGFSHAIIIVLAIVLITKITTKESSHSALDEFKKEITQKIDSDKASTDNKIKTVEDNLNRYQQLRESRAVLFSKRLDELYDLYKKDPSPIDSAKTVVKDFNSESANFGYMENKINKVDEKVDNVSSKVSSKLLILEQRVESLQFENKTGQRIINTNIQTVNNK